MNKSEPMTYVFNHTRQAFLAHQLRIADTHWTRLRGLLGTRKEEFSPGQGLWIVPCHGVHTLAMGYPIDVVYLDDARTVIHVEECVKPWRITPVRTDASSVLELPARTIWTTHTCIGDQLEIECAADNSDSIVADA